MLFLFRACLAQSPSLVFAPQIPSDAIVQRWPVRYLFWTSWSFLAGSRLGNLLCQPCLNQILNRLAMRALCPRPHVRMAPGSTNKASANGAGGHVIGSIAHVLEAGAGGGRSGRGSATRHGSPWHVVRMAKVGGAASTVGAGGR